MKRLCIFLSVLVFFLSSMVSFAADPEDFAPVPVEPWEEFGIMSFGVNDVSDDIWFNKLTEVALVSNNHENFSQLNNRGYNYGFRVEDISVSNFGLYGCLYGNSSARYFMYVLVSDEPFDATVSYCIYDSTYTSYPSEHSIKLSDGKYYLTNGISGVSYPRTYLSETKGVVCFFSNTVFRDRFLSNDGTDIDFPPANPDSYEYSSELGYLVGFDTRSKIYKISTSFYNEINEITFRTGWNNKTSSGLDLWRNSFSNIRIQPVIHVRSYGHDAFGNIIETKNEYLEQSEIPVEQVTYSYSTTGLFYDVPNIFIFSEPVVYTEYDFEIYFRILAEKDGKSYRGDWVSVSPDWTGMYNGKTPTVTVNPGEYIPGIGFRPGVGGSTTPIPVGTGSNEVEADNDIVDQLPSDVETPDFTNLLKSLTTLISQIGSIPSIISSVFSFLPAWCLLLAASSFGLMCVLMIYKLIRG